MPNHKDSVAGGAMPTTTSMDRRTVLTGATATTVAAAGVAALSTPATADEIGPIETLLIEHQRRYHFLATKADESWARDGRADWADAPLEEAIKLQPVGEREWASFILLTLDLGAVHWDAAEALLVAAESQLDHPAPTATWM